MSKRHILPMGTHKPLGSSWIKEVPTESEGGIKPPLAFTCGQALPMAETYARTMRKHRWDELRQLAKQMKSNIGPNNGD